jgi:hypothetical protein
MYRDIIIYRLDEPRSKYPRYKKPSSRIPKKAAKIFLGLGLVFSAFFWG